MSANMPDDSDKITNKLPHSNFQEGIDIENISNSFPETMCTPDVDELLNDFPTSFMASLRPSIEQKWKKQSFSQTSSYSALDVACKSKMTLPPLSSMFGNKYLQENSKSSVDRIGTHGVTLSEPSQNNKPADYNSSAFSYSNSEGFVKNTQTQLYSPTIEYANNSDVTMYGRIKAPKTGNTRKRHVHVAEIGPLPANVNVAFKNLRNLIPTEPVDRRLSKVETLRLAVSYIQHLGHTLNADQWVEQPCLSMGSISNENSTGSSICTFCMSKRRKMCVTSR